ncbi:MAG: methyltransferase [Winogradskyella sp.]|nr:methyltransferase [Winogradskyella sp.]
MSHKPFQFKQFTIEQDRCAMKIGTDSVLLGAWTKVNNLHSILDIGAGTGVLALMLAQRCSAPNIDALEIDAEAFEQCTNNFENSQWVDRLFCYHGSLLEFTEDIDDTYDLIICNPPFYSENYKTDDTARDMARFNDAMPFEHLVFAVSKLLSHKGIFSVIVPFKEEQLILDLARNYGLSPHRILRVKGTPQSAFKRSLLEFSFQSQTLIEEKLIIETTRHEYTQDYIDLTKEFYLKM